MTDRLYSPTEVAVITGFHRQVIYRAIRRGELPAFRICKRIRIRQEDLQGWIEREPIELAGSAVPPNSLPTRCSQGNRFRLVRNRELEGGLR